MRDVEGFFNDDVRMVLRNRRNDEGIVDFVVVPFVVVVVVCGVRIAEKSNV